ncbi:mechanosensitive ion channel domain-containing protein [Gillisia hiemivivida]|jgi:small-conductance mechanosensitive channel|uniref:Mechanosensitive ion channel n=1 Tax=Gillisia hiemivivida TaxID=291190 RepID=A0A5C6ZR83_9FLAO|nr:mechanosensitive ion channel domain-containing protein [Gillisia hiemivivida]TXD93156.1 mechanosensitive ion channel [Gillisia hiemivivida]
MKELFLIYKNEIIYTTIIVVSLLIIQFTMKKAAHRVGKQSEIHISRTRLMLKYINILVSLIAVFALAFAWGIGYKDLSLIFSSVFAVIGVALFAIWSILSNVTSGIILFFSFPYKIGDKIRIHDKDAPIIGVIDDIKAFHLHIINDEGELVTYPNNLILQKAVSLIKKDVYLDEGKDSL